VCLVLHPEAFAAIGLAAVIAVQPGVPTRDRVLLDPRITESSDLVASARHPGLVWTTNDSGDQARVFGVDRAGKSVAVLHLRGARARDWEALAPGLAPDGTALLWVGDIGDNRSTWPSVRVYRVVEPEALGDQDVAWTAYDLRFADGSRDAEALLVDPTDQRLYVVSKRVDGAAVYAAPARLRTDRVNVLTRVASAPSVVTDGAFAPDGGTVALRGYAWAWTATSVLGPWHRVDIPLQPQGESLTWTPDGAALLVGSEGERSEVWRVPLTTTATSSPTTSAQGGSHNSPSPSTTDTASRSGSVSAVGHSGGSSPGWRLLLGALALGAALSVAVAARRRR
jgi:Tol biopolymer transport system component